MRAFLQFLIVGLGAGATYALFAQYGYKAHDPVDNRPIDKCLENTLFIPEPRGPNSRPI